MNHCGPIYSQETLVKCLLLDQSPSEQYVHTSAERNSFIIMEPVRESKLQKRTLSGQHCTTDHKD